MLPTRGPFAGLGAQIPFVRRRLERMNREFGWGEMGDDDHAEGRKSPPKP
jgi:hypothetical protein